MIPCFGKAQKVGILQFPEKEMCVGVYTPTHISFSAIFLLWAE